MKNLGVKVTNYMDQAINKLETVLEQVDKGIGRTANALDLVEQDISTTVKKDLRTFRKGIKLFARLLNVVFTATFLLVLYLKFTQPDIYADLVRVMPAVLDTYVSQLPPWAGDAIDSLLDIVKKVLFWMQIYTQPTPKVGWYLPVGHHKKQGEPCFFLSLITTDKKVNSNSKSASGTEYFHRPYFYSFYLYIKKTKGENNV